MFGPRVLGFEIKSSTKWKADSNKGLETLLEEEKIDIAYGIYLGEDKLKIGNINVFPLSEFSFENLMKSSTEN